MSELTWDTIKGVAGCTYRQYDHWVTKGYIHTDDDHPSRGFPRALTWAEVGVLTILTDLVAAGMLPEAAAPLARTLAVSELAPFGDFVVSRATS